VKKITDIFKSDSDAIRGFADRVEKLEADGKKVRTTLIICAYDDDMLINVHTCERLSTVIGTLELAKPLVNEHFEVEFE